MSYVPVIDISADPDAVGRQLDEICRTVGFFQIVGHGIDRTLADQAWDVATAFFDLPLTEKLTVACPEPGLPYGYIPIAGESLSQSMGGSVPADLKEVFNVGPVTRPSHTFADPDEGWMYSANLWPAALPELREIWTRYYMAMTELTNRLMSLFARGLGLAPEYFVGFLDQSPNALRAINYPERDTAPLPGQLRAGAHTDYGTLTVLRQDGVGGLEVLDLDQQWVGVESIPDAFVINIGDLMARWTNDRWTSTLHRVVDPPNADQARARRQSMPYFQNANWSAEIACLPTCLGPGETPTYKPVLAGPHLMSKFRKAVALS